jgi:intron-binding protein aquarius
MGESKASSHIVPVMAPQPTELGSQLTSRPSAAAELQGENYFAEVAHKSWLKGAKPPKVLPAVLKDQLWDRLQKDGFAYGALLALETLQVLERYVGPRSKV